MADQKTKISVELETKNSQTIKDLREEFDRLKGELRATTLEYHQGQVSEEDYSAKAEILKEKMRDVKTSVENLGEKLKTAKSGMAGFGQSMLQTGRVVQDFAQGGLGGILNNIEGFTQAIGGGPGLAGALTVLGVAVLLVKPYLQEFFDSFKSDDPKTFGEQLGDLEIKIKTLTDKKHKIAIDYADLEKAKEHLEELRKIENEIKSLRESNTSEESKQKSAVQKAIVESGKEGAIEEGLLKSGMGHEEVQKEKDTQKSIQRIKEINQIIERQSQLRKGTAFPGLGEEVMLPLQLGKLEDERSKIEAKLEQKRRDAVRKLIVQAETDPKALEKLHQAVEKNPLHFAPGLQERLEEALPETRKFDEEQKKAQKELDHHKEVWKRTHAREKTEDESWAAQEAIADQELQLSNSKYKKYKSERKRREKTEQTQKLRDKHQAEKELEKTTAQMEKDLGKRLERDLLAIGSVNNPKARRKLKSKGMENLTRELRRRGVVAEQSYVIAEKMAAKAAQDLDSKLSARKHTLIDQGFTQFEAERVAKVAEMEALNADLAKHGLNKAQLKNGIVHPPSISPEKISDSTNRSKAKEAANQKAVIDHGLKPLQETQQQSIVIMSSMNAELAKFSQTQQKLKNEVSKIQKEVHVRRRRG